MLHKAFRSLAVPVAVCAILGAGVALAKPLPKLFVKKHERELVICKNTTFALCASSTCTATGGVIVGNDGIPFPAASCKCPVLVGDNIADLKEGNMDGSCEAPEGFVYSTFSLIDEYPQYIDGTWQEAEAVPLVCPAQYPYAQCWNWRCKIGEVVDGVQLADCTCPIQKTPYDFITQAGQGDPAYCEDIPIGGPLFFDPSSLSTR